MSDSIILTDPSQETLLSCILSGLSSSNIKSFEGRFDFSSPADLDIYVNSIENSFILSYKDNITGIPENYHKMDNRDLTTKLLVIDFFKINSIDTSSGENILIDGINSIVNELIDEYSDLSGSYSSYAGLTFTSDNTNLSYCLPVVQTEFFLNKNIISLWIFESGLSIIRYRQPSVPANYATELIYSFINSTKEKFINTFGPK